MLDRSGPARGNRIHVGRLSIACSAIELSRVGRRGGIRTHISPRSDRGGRSSWPHAPEWYPRENSNPDLHVRSVVSCPLNDGGENFGSGPENRTLPCTLVRGDHTLIRRARTPVLTTIGGAGRNRTGDWAVLQTAAFPFGYRACWQGRGDSNSRKQLWRLLSWPLNDGPAKPLSFNCQRTIKRPAFGAGLFRIRTVLRILPASPPWIRRHDVGATDLPGSKHTYAMRPALND